MAKAQKSTSEISKHVDNKCVLNGVQEFIGIISQIILSIFKIVTILFVFSFVVILTKGIILANVGGIVIEPFEISGFGTGPENNISGLALADLLSYELHRIKEIDDLGQRDTITPIIEVRAKEELSGYSDMEFIDLKTKSEEKSISELGTISVEPASFSLGALVLSIKGLLGHRPSTITGSLQRYGDVIYIVVKLEDNSSSETSIWKVKQTLAAYNQSVGEQVIPSLVKDLAFQMAHEMSRNQVKSKKAFPRNWQTFKNLTLARSDFLNYLVTNNTSDLDAVTNTLIEVRHSEPLYIGSFELLLLSDISKSYLKINKPEKAINLYKSIADLKPLESNFGLGVIYSKLGHYDDALKAFDNATKSNPRLFVSWYNKGLVLDNLGKYNESKRAYEKIIKFDPETSDDWFFQGLAQQRLGNYEGAVDAFNYGINLDPKSSHLWDVKGWSLYKMRDYTGAITAFDRAIDLDAQNKNPWINKGTALNGQGKYEEAIKAYDKAIELDPQYAFAWNNKAQALGNLKRYDEALQAAERAIKLDPERAPFWNIKAWILGNLKRYDEALQAAERAIKLDPEQASFWNNKAQALGNLKRYDEALQAAERAIKLDPKLADAGATKAWLLKNS